MKKKTKVKQISLLLVFVTLVFVVSRYADGVYEYFEKPDYVLGGQVLGDGYTFGGGRYYNEVTPIGRKERNEVLANKIRAKKLRDEIHIVKGRFKSIGSEYKRVDGVDMRISYTVGLTTMKYGKEDVNYFIKIPENKLTGVEEQLATIKRDDIIVVEVSDIYMRKHSVGYLQEYTAIQCTMYSEE